MRTEQSRWAHGWQPVPTLKDADLVLAFGSGATFEDADAWQALRKAYPDARIVGCSTAGEIMGERVSDDSLVCTAIQSASPMKVASAQVDGDAQDIAAALAQKLTRPDLRHVLVLSDGQHVNGSRLAAGFSAALPDGVVATGGLAGDGDRFKRTLVAVDGDLAEDRVVAVGFYGAIEAAYGSLGGWDPFGPQRIITKAQGNVLYELDGLPALQLYKKYLGEHAAGLPASGLLFPLSIAGVHDHELVRTILGIDEAEQSLTFAGDLPEGAAARLMKANFERLVDGAEGAARASRLADADLAILISCVGRKLVLKQRTEDELEAVREALGARPAMTGFYSYGEMCPAAPQADCELHNQTMTITTLTDHAPAP